MHRRPLISMGFCDQQFLAGSHICYVFTGEDERLDVIAAFLEAGDKNHEKLLYVVDAANSETIRGSLRARRLAPAAGGLVIDDAEAAYRPGGQFSTPGMLDAIRDFYLRAVAEGYGGARGTGELAWLSRHPEETTDVLDYEAKLTLLLQRFPYTAICQYGAQDFSGQTIMDVLSVHPYMIVRGQIVENPFCIDPGALVAARRSGERRESAG